MQQHAVYSNRTCTCMYLYQTNIGDVYSSPKSGPKHYSLMQQHLGLVNNSLGLRICKNNLMFKKTSITITVVQTCQFEAIYNMLTKLVLTVLGVNTGNAGH